MAENGNDIVLYCKQSFTPLSPPTDLYTYSRSPSFQISFLLAFIKNVYVGWSCYVLFILSELVFRCKYLLFPREQLTHEGTCAASNEFTNVTTPSDGKWAGTAFYIYTVIYKIVSYIKMGLVHVQTHFVILKAILSNMYVFMFYLGK